MERFIELSPAVCYSALWEHQDYCRLLICRFAFVAFPSTIFECRNVVVFTWILCYCYFIFGW